MLAIASVSHLGSSDVILALIFASFYWKAARMDGVWPPIWAVLSVVAWIVGSRFFGLGIIATQVLLFFGIAAGRAYLETRDEARRAE